MQQNSNSLPGSELARLPDGSKTFLRRGKIFGPKKPSTQLNFGSIFRIVDIVVLVLAYPNARSASSIPSHECPYTQLAQCLL